MACFGYISVNTLHKKMMIMMMMMMIIIIIIMSVLRHTIAIGRGKGKVSSWHAVQPHIEGRSTTLLILNLFARWRWGGSTPRPGCFILRKEPRYQLWRRMSGPRGCSGWVPNISPPLGLGHRTFQPVVSRYSISAFLAATFIRQMCSLNVSKRGTALGTEEGKKMESRL
jgi:hypothetical protein